MAVVREAVAVAEYPLGELEAARVVAKLVGAIVEHCEQLVAETLSAALAALPAALSSYQVESTPAAGLIVSIYRYLYLRRP